MSGNHQSGSPVQGDDNVANQARWEPANNGAMPRAFADKVRWRMQHDRNPLFVILQDKFAVKGYAQERGVASPAVFYRTTNPADLPFDQLPESCFIKANHGCGWNILHENGEFYYFGSGAQLLAPDGGLVEGVARTQYRVTRDDVVFLCRKMLGSRFGKGEWAYHEIDPCIFVEERLVSAVPGELMDYRFYTFDGVVKAINIGSATYRKAKCNAFMDLDWQLIPLTVYKERVPDPLPARPALLGEMIAAAQRIGAGVDFARVDLYQSSKGVMLGEVTLYPEGAKDDTPTACPRFNLWLGDAWRQKHALAGSWG